MLSLGNSSTIHPITSSHPHLQASDNYLYNNLSLKKTNLLQPIHPNTFDDQYPGRGDIQHAKLSPSSAPTISFIGFIQDWLICLWSFISSKFHNICSKHQDQLLPSHRREPTLPQLYKLIIPISGFNLEIEGRQIHSEKLKDVHYQIYRRQDLPHNKIKADIIFLPETPLNGPTDVSPLMATFIHGGHRIIIPRVNRSKNSDLDVGHQSRIIAMVLRHLNFKEQPSENKFQADQQIIETITTHQTLSSLSSSSSSSTSSSRPPIFLLGLGKAALVALSYPLEIGQPIHEFPQSLPSSDALSIPSVSARAEPPRSLMGNLSSFCDSVNSGITGLGWWAQGTAKRSRAEFKSWGPLPKISGIIAISPMLEPSGTKLERNHNWFKKSKKISQGIGPTNYSPSMINAVTRLHANASNIRVPVMIAHGTKEAFSLIEGISSFYGALASVDSTLLFCPTLHHSGDLAGESTRNGLANDCMKWIGERSGCFKPTTPAVPTQTTCLPGPQKDHLKPINHDPARYQDKSVNSVETASVATLIATEPAVGNRGKRSDQLEEVDCASDFGSWFGTEGDSSLSRNHKGDRETVRSLSSHNAIRLSSGSYIYSTEQLGSISLEITSDSFQDSPHLSSGFSTPLPRTPATDYFPFLPSSAKIIDHHHGPHGVVSVVRNNRESYHSLSCVNIPGSSLGFY